MRKTVPQYTIFTCDCCGREQDDSAFQQDLDTYGAPSEYGPEPLRIFPIKWSKRDMNFKEWQDENSMEVCSECSTRIHDAIQEVIRKASAENVREQLAIIERTHS